MKSITLLSSILLSPMLVVPTLVDRLPAIAQTSPATPIAAPEIGFEFLGSRDLNRTSLTVTEYTGDCPGRDEESREARFISTQTRPSEHRRVVIKNVTRGLGETPYTDREYDKGRVSEGTVMRFGTEHSSKHFIVLPGENTFQYEIREREQPIMTGTFNAVIDQTVRRIERNAQWSRDRVCANPSVSTSNCADLREREQLACPGGRVLQTRWNDDRPIRTTLYNRTNQTIHFTYDGDTYRLSSGDRISVRNNRDLRIGYDPKCANCTPTKYESVTHGKRVQFKLSNGKIDLTDDRDW